MQKSKILGVFTVDMVWYVNHLRYLVLWVQNPSSGQSLISVFVWLL